MTYLWSFPDVAEPVASNVAFPDHVVGRLGATLATALLIARERRSSGLHAEIVQGEVAINLMSHLFLKEALDPGFGRAGREPLGPGCAVGRLPVRRRAALVRDHLP